MTQETRAVLISGDANLRTVVGDALRGAGLPVTVELELATAVHRLYPEDEERLRTVGPELVFVDLSEDPDPAIRAAGAIALANPGAALVGIGPDLDSARLLDAMRAGVVEYVPRPVQPSTLVDALERVLRKRGWAASREPRRNGQLLAFFSPKGGAGSTSVMTNVGIELHRLTGGKTLLVDLDLELGEIASLLGVQPRFHFVDLVKNFHRMDADLLASYIESHESGVQVLSAPFEPEIGEEVTGEQIARILGFLREHYDHVLVDISKSLAPPALAALQAADPIVLVTNMDVPSLRNMKRCLPTLDRVTGGDSSRLRLVVNRYNPRSLVGLDDLEETLGIEVFATLSNDYRTVIESISTGRPLVQGSSRYAEELRDLALDILEGPEEGEEKGRSLFGRLLSPFRSGAPRPNGRGTLPASPEEAPTHG